MKLDIVAKTCSTLAGKLGPIGARLSKNSPAIFTGAGVALMVGGCVLSGWATLKAKKVMDEPVIVPAEDQESAKKEALRKGAKVIGYYAPAVASAGVGIACVVHGHNIQEARVTAAVSAYSMLAASFAEYRERVVEKHGEEADRKFLKGTEKAKADIYEEPDEDGKAKKHKEEVLVKAKSDASPYAAIFDDYCPDWTRSRSDNLYFIRCQERAANLKLQSRGYLFLSEVLEMLGLPYNPAGQFVGWIDEAYEGSKSGIVDFGLSEVYLQEELEQAKLEARNPEPSIWLDFKVDGEIWDKIPLVRKQMR